MLSTNWMAKLGSSAISRMLLLGLIGCLSTGLASAASNVPAVVISTKVTTATGLTGNEAGVALDACGNIYAIASSGGQVTEIPAGGGAPTTVLAAAGDNWGANGLFIDSAKSNLYITLGSHQVTRYPIVNCAVQSGNGTSFSIGNVGAISYWYTTSAVASDASGNVFIATNNACCAPANELLEEDATNSHGKALLSSMPAPIDSMTVDAANNIFFVSGGALYELPYASGAYASSALTFGGPFNKATGVSIDPAGNLYVTDSLASKIYEIPFESGTLNPANQFLVASGVAATSALAFGMPGDFYFTNNGSIVYDLRVGYANLGTAAISGSGNSTATVGVAFNATVTPATIGFAGAPGVFTAGAASDCAIKSYAAGDTCTVAATFTPSVPGLATGSLVLADNQGATLGSATITGIGLGAGLTADPGAQTAIGSGFKTPASVAVDALGNTFIADSGASAVWEIPAGNGTPAAVGTGLNAPAGVAVDGAGNVFIADTGSNQIVEVPLVGAALNSAAQTVIVSSSTVLAGSALNKPSGLALDAGGNLYIADTGNNRVVYLPQANNFSAAVAVTAGSGFSAPLAIAVAPSGIVYIADSGNGKVYSIPYPTAPQTLVAASLNNPSALAVDAAGDLFVVDSGNEKVLRIPRIAGSLISASAINVATGITNPYGLALDAAGNLYISDGLNASAYSIARTNASQSFGKWSPNTPSSALAFTIENSGNQALTFSETLFTATGDTAEFAISPAGGNACAPGASVNTGAACSISAIFTAPDLGSYSETLALSSNAANATAPQITFAGLGAQTTATTTTLAVTSPAGNPVYGQPITLTATVAAASGAPVGNVQLLVDDNLAATSAIKDGTATFSLATGLPGGSHAIQAVYPGGDADFETFSHSSSGIANIVVARAATAAALDFTTLYTDPLSQPAGTAITLTATVTPAVAGIPSGSVTFTITEADGTKITQAQPLSPVAGGAFEAVYTYTPAAPVNAPVASASITAAYAGDTNFGASSTATKSFFVSPGSGSVVETPSALSVTSGTTGTSAVSFTATSYGGWNGLIGFGCLASSLPANTRCVFSPGQIQVMPSTSAAPANNVPISLSVTVNQPPQTPTASQLMWWLALPAGLLLFFARRRFMRNSWSAFAMLIGGLALGIAATGLTACSSTGFRTPAGTTNITVYAWADPFTAMPSSGNATPSTQTCGINTTTGKADPALAPCSQATFQVAVTIK
jgi:sugar lactone lactonase YvrE